MSAHGIAILCGVVTAVLCALLGYALLPALVIGAAVAGFLIVLYTVAM